MKNLNENPSNAKKLAIGITTKSKSPRKTPKPRRPKIYTVETLDTRSHAFNVGIAIDFNPEMALWLGHLAFFSEKNLANKHNIHDGLVWSYNTIEALGDQFPYLTKSQRETMINNSIKEGLVVTGNYNRTSYDRTNWYALTPKAYFYFPHLVIEKYIKLLYNSISEISEMDFSEFGNGFPRFRMTIPDTTPDPDPDKKSVGATPSQHTVTPFPSKSEIQAKKSFEDIDAKSFFNTKFKGLSITYEQLFNDCKEHYESKGQWLTLKKWKAWLEREKLDNYSKTNANAIKAPIEETDQQRKERQYFTYELIKEKDNPEYISKDLQRYPEMRDKYARYAR